MVRYKIKEKSMYLMKYYTMMYPVLNKAPHHEMYGEVEVNQK
jgi:hypothetical protein